MKTCFRKKLNNFKRKTAFTLIEILVAIGLFAIVASSVSFFSIDSNRISQNVLLKTKAISALQETLNALQINKESSWSTILQNTSSSPMHLSFSGNTYQILPGATTQNNINISFTINQISRDGSGNIVSSGGSLDNSTRGINITASWTDNYGTPQSLSTVHYVNDWNLYKWTETTTANFNAGTQNNTIVTTNTDGEVSLDTLVYANWCNPVSSFASVDFSGNGNPNAISAAPYNVVAGTGGTSSGSRFVQVNVTDANPPSGTIGGNLGAQGNNKTNGLFTDGTYAYLANTNNGEEVQILNNINTTPTVVGWFHPPNGQADTISVANNRGYVVGGNTLYVFDLGTPGGAINVTGARPIVGSGLNLASTAKKIQIVGNYAYIALSNSSTQMQVVDISNPASLSIVAQATLNAQAGTDIYIKPDGTRAYLTTAASASQKEFWILDTTTKSGNMPIIGSFDANGMSPNGVFAIPSDNRAIIAGSGGQQYQVLDISNEAAPSLCGGLNVATTIYQIAAVTYPSGNVYTYALTADSGGELKIIKGGKGAGNGQGNAYPQSGDFTSQIFDTGSNISTLQSIDWNSLTPAGTTLQFQIRSGNTVTEINANSWLGPDGTNTTYYTSPTGSYIPSNSQGKRYIQYKAYFIADSSKVYTPVFQLINIKYQK